MATITEIQLQDGSVHQLGGGGGGSTTYTLSKSGSTITLTGSGGDTSSVTDANTTYTFSISGNTITVTPSSGPPQTITLPDDDTTYTLSAVGDTITLTGSDGSTSSVTVSTTDTTYVLSKSGNTITLTGSDGSTTSVTDSDTTYGGMTQAQGEAGTNTTNMVISPKVLHDTIEALDDNTTYSISISGHTITLTPSSGTAQSVTVPDNNTTYTISKSGSTVTLTGSDGSTSTFTDANTTYSAGTGLSLSGTTFNHNNSITAVTSASFVKVTYDAQGHITGTSAVTKSDITALGIPSSDTNNRRAFYGTCSTAAATAAKVVTISNTTGWELIAGTVIGVKFSASNTASNVTLNVNSTGAKSIYYNNAVYTGSSNGVCGYANRTSYYMYDGTYWVFMAQGVTDANTYDRTYLSNSGYKAGSSAIVAGNIITANTSGLYQHLKSGSAFDITMPILYASSAANASATNNGGYIIIPFTITTTQSLTLTAYKAIYIKGQLSGITFTPVSTTPLTQTIPTTADGYEYMLLGYATTTTVAYLLPEHPIYAYTGGAFTRIGGRAITNITRSGTTFTATREDNSTFTFTQQDNNTTTASGISATDASGNTSNVQALLDKPLYAASSSKAISSSDIDTRTNGASVTLPAGHNYLIVAQWTFNTRTTSGTTNSQITIHNGTEIVAQQRIFASGNNYNVLQCVYMTNLLSGNVTYTVQGSSSRPYTSATTNWIRAIALN